MVFCQETTTDSNPRKKCSSTLPLQLSLLALFILVLALFITGVTLDILKNNHEALFEYNYVRTNQYYDYPLSEKDKASKKIQLENELDLKAPLARKIKRDYFLHFPTTLVTKLETNHHPTPENLVSNQVFMGQAKNLETWKKQRMMNDEATFHDHILNIFPYRMVPYQMASPTKIFHDQWLPEPTKRFYPMSTKAVNTFNSRNKQLIMNEAEKLDGSALLFLLYHYLQHPITQKQKDRQGLIKGINKRYLPFHFLNVQNWEKAKLNRHDEEISNRLNHLISLKNQEKKRKRMKWALYRNFPSFILDSSMDENIGESIDDNNSKDVDDFNNEQEGENLSNNIALNDHEELYGELQGLLRNMKDPRLSFMDNIRNLRLT